MDIHVGWSEFWFFIAGAAFGMVLLTFGAMSQMLNERERP